MRQVLKLDLMILYNIGEHSKILLNMLATLRIASLYLLQIIYILIQGKDLYGLILLEHIQFGSISI